MARTMIWLFAVLLVWAVGLPKPAAADATFEFIQTSDPAASDGYVAQGTAVISNAAYLYPSDVVYASLSFPGPAYNPSISGIIEFATMTTAVFFAWKRTRDDSSWVSKGVKATALAMLIGYPLLAVAYLTDRFGAFVEPIFFVSFCAMVAIELFEPRRRPINAGEVSVS